MEYQPIYVWGNACYLAYYFSTHGCRFWASLGAVDLDDDAPLVAAAAARALLSKKLAIVYLSELSEQK